ncbi:FAD-dependent oxidoreductase [Brevibacterium aurantiacum]|uniref:FAD-binding dehydrogenase n=1 Tax=Brevibacterium aurantiacum TaxID=273384 RepID=A0A2A3Z1T0_BREAU|nr:FAD-dependent oxidoreductase [Brevibacterium aurantiacum]PCC45514.1 FAD-binding dehydrogenase [Brevibacterium aurantiacum]
MNDWDVVVIGAGGAGLAAAISAAERGSKVVVFESETEVGGSTQLSAGMFTAAGTSVQKAVGVNDTADRFFQHYMDLNQWKLRPGLVRKFCQQSGPTLEWLIGLGVDFPAAISSNAHEPGLTQAGVEDVWRGHVPRDQGYGLVQVLDRSRRSQGIDLILNTRVEDLLIESGQVVGVKADNVDVHANSVIIASGGFSHNRSLLERFYPEALAAGDDLFIVAGTGSRGDHIRLAESVDAELEGHGTGLLLVTAYLQQLHHWQAGFPPKSRIYVDKTGRRFMNEDISYAVASGILHKAGGSAWTVFDERARTGLPSGYANWTAESVRHEADAGRMSTAPTLAELATKLSIPQTALSSEVERWNNQLPRGVDRDFMRNETLVNKGDSTSPDPIQEPPFYAARTVPAELVCTHTGLAIDESARVRDSAGRTITGLYAAGEAGAGVLGERYVGGGNSIANALTMGRIAGLSSTTT